MQPVTTRSDPGTRGTQEGLESQKKMLFHVTSSLSWISLGSIPAVRHHIRLFWVQLVYHHLSFTA